MTRRDSYDIIAESGETVCSESGAPIPRMGETVVVDGFAYTVTRVVYDYQPSEPFIKVFVEKKE